MTKPGAVAHILVVDDEAEVRLLLRQCFELEGYRVSEAATSAEAVACLSGDPAGLVTLDLKLGGENGLDVARAIRQTQSVPIVMITGKGDPVDRIVGLELGADDYISKPFHLREVLARVRAVLRRSEASAISEKRPQPGPRYLFGNWVLDVGRRELRGDGGDLRELTTAEFDLLLMFLQRPARPLSRDIIMDQLKGHEWSPFDRSIDSLVVRLRKKIEAEPDRPQLLKTVRGVGYVFAGDVRAA
jgi:two-component system, OmpR family, response regulator